MVVIHAKPGFFFLLQALTEGVQPPREQKKTLVLSLEEMHSTISSKQSFSLESFYQLLRARVFYGNIDYGAWLLHCITTAALPIPALFAPAIKEFVSRYYCNTNGGHTPTLSHTLFFFLAVYLKISI